MIRNLILYIFLLNVLVLISPAQEVVSGLQSNYSITSVLKKQKNNKASATPDTLELPFFDDFSNQSVFPDNNKWQDNFVFINNTYSDQQITKGIATLDALDEFGRLYETASPSIFKADQLTSQPVNLNYAASEDVWLSFFYQAGGLADTAEINDSLTLQFLAPEENLWYSVWKVGGIANQKFKPVIIKIDESRFLQKGFQFRFINYASLSPSPDNPSWMGNCDIWNIDYVLLDKNRNEGDTIFPDVAFRLPLRSLLKNHEAMPWSQFKEIELQEMGYSIPIHYRNNDIITRNVTHNFEIWDVYKNTQSHFFSSGATNIDPSTNIDYSASLIYNYYNPNTANYDSALFKITCTLKTDEFDPKENDTLVYYQNFTNYFAFDDGTAEAGYGINGLGTRNAMVAYRFKSFIQDTLRAIQICFNDSYLNANLRAFDLMVWDDNNGMPGNILYSEEEVLVEQGTLINGFYTYKIPKGIMIDDIFYIGWRQLSETFLNAGYDINTYHEGKQFYSLNGEWNQSQKEGSLMIRPVVGAPLLSTAINDTYYRNKNLINIWPNPASDYININTSDLRITEQSRVTILDIYGRKLIDITASERIDISSLHSGVYILLLIINDKTIGYSRLIKIR
jgi:type IX secretion system substrate protein